MSRGVEPRRLRVNPDRPDRCEERKKLVTPVTLREIPGFQANFCCDNAVTPRHTWWSVSMPSLGDKLPCQAAGAASSTIGRDDLNRPRHRNDFAGKLTVCFFPRNIVDTVHVVPSRRYSNRFNISGVPPSLYFNASSDRVGG